MNYWQQSWKRWLVWSMLASLFAVSCVLLSDWQFNRRSEKVAELKILATNYDLPAKPIEDLLQSSKKTDVKWRQAEVDGRYLVDAAVLLRNRPLNGQPGFEQVVPFKFAGGIILVDRGWLPTGSEQDSPDQNPLPNAAKQRIVVRLLPSENDSGRGAPEGQIADLNLEKAAATMGLEINTEWYGRAVTSGMLLPKPLPKPQSDEGNHLSYAIQWLVFGAMALAFLIYSIRTEWRFAKGIVPKPRRSRSAEDSAAEDRLIG